MRKNVVAILLGVSIFGLGCLGLGNVSNATEIDPTGIISDFNNTGESLDGENNRELNQVESHEDSQISDDLNESTLLENQQARRVALGASSQVMPTGITIGTEGLNYTYDNAYLSIGNQITLNASILPENASIEDVSWSVVNEKNTNGSVVDSGSVLRVDTDTTSGLRGTFIAVGAGQATIRVTVPSSDSENVSSEVDVLVMPKVTDVIYNNGTWYNIVNGELSKNITVANNSNGWWYINDQGVVDFSYNGFANNQNGRWYLKNGKVSFDANGLYSDGIDEYYVVDSKVQLEKTSVININGYWYNIVNGKLVKGVTVAENANGWWYINSDGIVDFSYTGLASNQNGTWYLQNGKLDFGYTNIVNVKGTWYNIIGGGLSKKVTVAHNENGWFYIDQDGKVDFSFTGFADNANGKWYLENGKVSFSTTGIFNNGSTDLYVVGSKFRPDVTDIVNVHGGWYNIVSGKLAKRETVAHNSNGWFYINSEGKVDFSYYGLASNENGTWYCKKGKVDFSTSDVISINGFKYYIEGDKLTSGPSVEHSSIDGKWYYINSNGQVDETYNGFADNRYGRWYLENGTVSFAVTGLFQDGVDTVYIEGSKILYGTTDIIKIGDIWYNIVNGKLEKSVTVAHNSNGWFYIDQDGKVDFSFTGLASNTYGTWYCKNGKVDFMTTDIVEINGDYYNIVRDELVKGPTVSQSLSDGKWYYINSAGKLDKTFTGMASNSNGCWYLENGVVGFNVTDVKNVGDVWYNLVESKVVPNTVAENSNGWWYINSLGIVDFGFNGLAENQNGLWLISGGKVDFGANTSSYWYGGLEYSISGGKATRKYNYVIVLDAGHGGSDSGAVNGGMYEKNINLGIALACKAELERYNGVTVILTRSGDNYIGLTERSVIAANSGATVLVSLHTNSGSADAHGAEVWVPNANYNSHCNVVGTAVGKNILRELSNLGLSNRGVKTRNTQYDRYSDGSLQDYYSINRESKLRGITGIIVEHGFIGNATDRNYLANPTALGQADARGIAAYLGLSRK